MVRTALVVTSINKPNRVIADLAKGAAECAWQFIVIGDKKSPADFAYEGVDYYSIARQQELGFAYAQHCPTGHYARKNIGYLIAIQEHADIIVETDDDNIPRDGFWSERQRAGTWPAYPKTGWVNAYRYFSDALIWPRGLPLDQVQVATLPYDAIPMVASDCPIQQGLADENPDVDAIYRLLLPLPQNFSKHRDLVLPNGAWCPFNSQNTTWWRDAFALLYLPAYCSFRMTDIWRSFIAQRIAWECGWSLRFHDSTVWQERNEHSLMRDFADEVPGYLHNSAIAERLMALSLCPGREAIGENLRRCYELMVREQWVGKEELPLLDHWLHDLEVLGCASPQPSAKLLTN